MELLNLTTERIDDLPLLLGQMESIGMADLLDQAFPTHGNWQGLSLGQVTQVWLAHILSEANHRLNHVQPWVEGRIEMLRMLVSPSLQALDFTDDRLAAVLRYMNDTPRWEAFEAILSRRLVRIYDLDRLPDSDSLAPVRLDATTVSSYGAVLDQPGQEGLLQLGYSKDHRPDLGQLKLMLATLDPWGLPLVSLIVPGDRADDPLYRPVIERAQQSLPPKRGEERGRLYVGDCKLTSLSTRAFLAKSGDHYLGPLSERAWSEKADDLTGVLAGTQEMTRIERTNEKGEVETIATGFEVEAIRTAEVDGVPFTWTERRLILRSVAFAKAQEAALLERLRKAETALMSLLEVKRGKRRLETREAVEEAVNTLRRRYEVEGLLEVTVIEQIQERIVRAYGERLEEVRVEQKFGLTGETNEEALQARITTLGWRAYVTDAPAERISLSQAVDLYRQEFRIEQAFGRLKGKPLSLSPLYLQRDDHLQGLVRLLTLALRNLVVLEGVARRHLQQEAAALEGLYAGQPTRKTTRPTAEKLLKAFEGITLTLIHQPSGRLTHLTPLSALQLRILHLLALPLDLYSFSLPRPQMGEP